MEYLKIFLLAVIQGAAELLPVSSSAHVIVAEKLMGMDPKSPQMVFLLVMLHTGTMFAVLWYFWPRWRLLIRGRAEAPPAEKQSRALHFLVAIIVATGATGVLGYGLLLLLELVVLPRALGKSKAEVEELFANLGVVGGALFAAGVLILAAGYLTRAEAAERPEEEVAPRSSLSLWSALWIGLVQGLCLPFRGFSRSGATISTGLFLGVPRQRAEDFSFALAVVLTPPVIGRGLWKLLKDQQLTSQAQLVELLLPGLVGMVFSFAAGLVALKLLSAALERGLWRYFGYYCLVAALVVLGMAYAGW